MSSRAASARSSERRQREGSERGERRGACAISTCHAARAAAVPDDAARARSTGAAAGRDTTRSTGAAGRDTARSSGAAAGYATAWSTGAAAGRATAGPTSPTRSASARELATGLDADGRRAAAGRAARTAVDGVVARRAERRLVAVEARVAAVVAGLPDELSVALLALSEVRERGSPAHRLEEVREAEEREAGAGGGRPQRHDRTRVATFASRKPLIPELKALAVWGKSVAGAIETELATHRPRPWPAIAGATGMDIVIGAACASPGEPARRAKVAAHAIARTAGSARRKRMRKPRGARTWVNRHMGRGYTVRRQVSGSAAPLWSALPS